MGEACSVGFGCVSSLGGFMRLRAAFNYDRFGASQESAVRCDDATRTVQSSKTDADINVIVSRFKVTGLMPQNVRVPLTEDFDKVSNFQDSLNLIVEAKRAFMQMPWDVRKRFANDPAEFVAFVSDPKNAEDCIKWGIAIKRPPKVDPPPVKVEVINKVDNAPAK